MPLTDTDEGLARARLAFISAGQRPLSGPRRALGDDVGPPAPSPAPMADQLERMLERFSDGDLLPEPAAPVPVPAVAQEPSAGRARGVAQEESSAGRARGVAQEESSAGRARGVAHEESPAGEGAQAAAPGREEQRTGLAAALALGRQHAVALLVLLLCGVGVAVTVLTQSSASEVSLEPTPEPAPAAVSPEPGPPGPSVPAFVRVHVIGAVRRPGVVSVPADAIVQDAVESAGGLTADADPGELNLAAKVGDGQQIVVGTRDQPGGEVRDPVGQPSGGAASNGAAGGLVNLNTATQAQFEELPGVGPVTAAAIIAWRDEHGKFSSVAELQEVSGIGPKSFAKLQPLVTV